MRRTLDATVSNRSKKPMPRTFTSASGPKDRLHRPPRAPVTTNRNTQAHPRLKPRSSVRYATPTSIREMDEVRAAYGLLNLEQVDEAIEKRHQVAIRYREALRDVKGIRFFDDMPGVRHNYSYFPIFIDAEEYGMTRDELYFKMKEQGVYGRRYFYPLISTFSTYCGLPSASPENLPVATRVANEVICLPMHHGLSEEDISRILELIV